MISLRRCLLPGDRVLSVPETLLGGTTHDLSGTRENKVSLSGVGLMQQWQWTDTVVLKVVPDTRPYGP